jgi:hypothetical protein
MSMELCWARASRGTATYAGEKKESLSQCHFVCCKSHIYWLAIGFVPPTSDAQINVISLSDVGKFTLLSHCTTLPSSSMWEMMK